MTTTVIDQLAEEEPDLQKVNSFLKPFFVVLFPHYGLGQGFIQMAVLYNTGKANSILGRNGSYDPFKFEKVGRNLLAMFIQGIVYNLINILIQYQFFIRIKPISNFKDLKSFNSENDDEDVLNETKRISDNEKVPKEKKFIFELNNRKNNKRKISAKEINNNVSPTINNFEIKKMDDEENDFVKLVNLTKVFRKFEKFKIKKHVAVNNLSIGINKGECFGLIGINGAGRIWIIF